MNRRYVLGALLVACAASRADAVFVTGCDAPLLEGAGFEAGVYELVFGAGAYFGAQGTGGPRPPFVGDVVLRFGIADAAQHYHVPLLVSPWSWSTYRTRAS